MGRSSNATRFALLSQDRVATEPAPRARSRSSQVRSIELVGLAGVGKSHLLMRLADWYGERGLLHAHATPTWRDLPSLARVFVAVAPLLAQTIASRRSPLTRRLHYAGRFVMHAWRDAVAARMAGDERVVLVAEGWFHKLRQIRRMRGSDVAITDLPESARRALFDVDLVVLLKADPAVICARKLRRRGKPVTPETLQWQHDASAALGQWDEYTRTRRDLEQASSVWGQAFVEIDYRDGYDVELDLAPLLARHGLV